jgi:hypothetical protein
MTPAEQAKAYALRRASLDWDERDTWSDTDRRAYLTGIGEFRRQNPTMFSPAELAAADLYSFAGAQPELKFSYVAETGKALSENVAGFGRAVASVGEGIKSGLSQTRWLIPLMVVAAAVILLRSLASSLPSKK